MSLAIGMILSSIGVTLFLVWARRPKDTQTPNTMKYPKAMAFIGAFGVLFIAMAFALVAIQGFPQNLLFIFFPVLPAFLLWIGCVGLFVNSMNWELTVSEEGLIYKNLFGRKREYRYSDITRIEAYYHKRTGMLFKYKIYVSGKKITLEFMVENFSTFEQRIKRMLRKAKNPIKIEVVFRKLTI